MTRRVVERGRLAEAILGAVGRAVIATDEVGVVTFWNGAAERLYGWTETEAVGRPINDLVVPAEVTQDALDIVAGALEGTTWEGDFVARRRDGSTVLIRCTNRPLRDATGEVIGVIGESEDVTEQRRIEADAADRARTVARLRGLQAVSAGLAAASTPAEVIEVIVRDGSTVLGGRTGSLCLLDDDGATFELVREVGLEQDVAESWRTFPADAPVPAADAVRTGSIVVMPSLAERDRMYPVFAGTPVHDGAFATVPLLLESGRPLGAFTVGFADARPFDDGDVEFLRTLGDLCAQAIDRAQLFEATAAAHLAARRASDRLALLADATGALASSLDPREVLAALAGVVVPTLADACAITLFDERTDTPPVVVHHGEPAVAESPAGVVVPLVARGRTIGTMAVGNHPGRAMTEDDVVLARELAERGALAADHARLFEDRSRVAATLQASLLPPTLPDIAGIDLGAVYVAAGAGAEVGGDFYDAFPLDADRWFLAIGDVRGKGVEAAEVTALARHTMRSAAVTDADPAAVLRHLNEMLLRSHRGGDVEPRFCTVVAALVERVAPDRALLTVAVGGHPLPILRSHGEVREIGTPGTVLGVVPEVHLHSVSEVLGAGDLVVLYTDGVSERRDGARFFETSGLLDAVGTSSGDSAAVVAGAIEAAVRDYAAAPPADDMAILVLRITPPA